MADEKKYIEEPIERKPAGNDSSSRAAAAIEEPIERAAAATPPASTIPKNYGFTLPNMASVAKEGLVGLGRGALSLGHDVLTNPDWLVGQGKTTLEKISDPNTTFNKFFAGPAMEEHGKASRMWKDLKDQSRTTGRAPLEKIVEMGGHEAASLLPVLGPWAANLGERAGTGDIGGAVASGGVQALAGAALPKVIGKVGEEIGAVPRVWRGLKALGDKGEPVEPVTPKASATPVKPTLKPIAEPPVTLGTPGPRAAKAPYFNPEGMAPAEPSEIKPIAQPFPKEVGYKPSEKAATMGAPRKPLGPEFEEAERSHEIERSKSILRNPKATAEEQSIAQSRLTESRPLRAVTPAAPTPTVESIVDQATGVKPLKADVALREQLSKIPTNMPSEVDPLKQKYPDPAVRQMVRANGEKIYEAAKGNPKTMKAIHDLTRVDLRQALINAGEDMGQKTVSDSKFAGEGSIPREEAFNRLLAKGHSPEQILELAKAEMKGAK